jgi:hypothetical protein
VDPTDPSHPLYSKVALAAHNKEKSLYDIYLKFFSKSFHKKTAQASFPFWKKLISCLCFQKWYLGLGDLLFIGAAYAPPPKIILSAQNQEMPEMTAAQIEWVKDTSRLVKTSQFSQKRAKMLAIHSALFFHLNEHSLKNGRLMELELDVVFLTAAKELHQIESSRGRFPDESAFFCALMERSLFCAGVELPPLSALMMFYNQCGALSKPVFRRSKMTMVFLIFPFFFSLSPVFPLRTILYQSNDFIPVENSLRNDDLDFISTQIIKVLFSFPSSSSFFFSNDFQVLFLISFKFFPLFRTFFFLPKKNNSFL